MSQDTLKQLLQLEWLFYHKKMYPTSNVNDINELMEQGTAFLKEYGQPVFFEVLEYLLDEYFILFNNPEERPEMTGLFELLKFIAERYQTRYQINIE